MKIVTIMDNVVDKNFETLCHVWLKQVHLSNPSEIIVLYNKNSPHFLKDYPLVKLVYCNHDSYFEKGIFKNSEKHKLVSFFVGFKLYNILKLEGPFIYLDVDAIPVGDIRELWDVRNDKPFIGCGHLRTKSLKDVAVRHGLNQDVRKFLNGGVLVVSDSSFIDYNRIKEILYNNAKKEEDSIFIFDDVLLSIYFEEINYVFNHEKIDNRWNASSKLMFKIIQLQDSVEIVAKDDYSTVRGVKILHFCGSDAKPWITRCPYYDFLLKKFKL